MLSQDKSKWRYLLYLALAILFLGIVALIFPENYESCYPNEKPQKDDCSVNSLYPFFFLSLGNLAQKYNAGITAFSTFMVMIITGILAYIAVKQREVTASQVTHLANIERAYVYVGPVDIHIINAATPETIVCLQVQNQGRTPAILKKVYGRVTKEPVTGKPYYPENDVRDLQVRRFDSAVRAQSALERLPMVWRFNTTEPFYFFGYVEYDDIFQNRRTCRFCSKIYPDRREHDIFASDEWSADY